MNKQGHQIDWPAEWATQKATLIVWPHKSHDWLNNLKEVELSYIDMSRAITHHQCLYIIAFDEKHQEHIKSRLIYLDPSFTIEYFIIKSNDTWVRDSGPITILKDEKAVCLDFEFNAWGKKYNFDLDNLITRNLLKDTRLSAYGYESINFILEGGSIESDGKGSLLTTSTCLLNPNRNPDLDLSFLDKNLHDYFGVSQTLWLDIEPLDGDDTDGHIDTIARFCPNNVICYLSDESGKNSNLASLERQLKSFSNVSGEAYQLVPLPYEEVFNASYDKLPASYANFIIINGAILMPQYGIPSDRAAMENIQLCFPEYVIYPIQAKCFIEQGGSLHCLSMHIPNLQRN